MEVNEAKSAGESNGMTDNCHETDTEVWGESIPRQSSRTITWSTLLPPPQRMTPFVNGPLTVENKGEVTKTEAQNNAGHIGTLVLPHRKPGTNLKKKVI